MKQELKQLLLAAKIALWVMWPLTATAATITFGDRMASIPALAVVMTLILSNLCGVTALLHAIKKEYEQGRQIDRLWLFMACKLLGSNTAGLMAFFGAEYYDIPDAGEALAICIAAFGGGPLIERAVGVFADKYLPMEAR
jgi:hypothetical protein